MVFRPHPPATTLFTCCRSQPRAHSSTLLPTYLDSDSDVSPWQSRLLYGELAFIGEDGGGLREQFTIYVETAPETTLTFADRATVEARIVRPVQEGALLFDPKERMLDIVAKGGGKARRRQIADAFVETMLVPGTALAERARRTLALDMLKHRPTFDVRPEDHVHSVKVARVVLGAPDFGAIATFEVSGSDQGRSGGDLYDRQSAHSAATAYPRGKAGR